MVDGTWVDLVGPRYPDPDAEAVRRQIAEGEHVQAIGRGRGVVRDSGSPLDVLVLCSLPLTLPVSRFISASQLAATPSEEMLRKGGVVLRNSTHASRAYPSVWRNPAAAKQAFSRARTATNAYLQPYLALSHHPLLEYAYQLEGVGQKASQALYDPQAVPDPRVWLKSNLRQRLAGAAMDTLPHSASRGLLSSLTPTRDRPIGRVPRAENPGSREGPSAHPGNSPGSGAGCPVSLA